MNKDIERLVGHTVDSVHVFLNAVHAKCNSLDVCYVVISEPRMVIDSITGGLFRLVGCVIDCVRRSEETTASSKGGVKKLVTYFIYTRHGDVTVSFKEPSND